MRRGFSLLLLLVSLVLIGAFSLVFVRTFALSMQSTRAASKAEIQTVRLDDLLAALQRDVWRATTIRADGGQLTLRIDGQDVTWNASDQSIQRGGTPQRRWDNLELRLRFAGHPAGVELVIADLRGVELSRRILASANVGGRP